MLKEARNNPFIFDRKRLNDSRPDYPHHEMLKYSYWKKGLAMTQNEVCWEEVVADAKSIKDYSDVVDWYVRGVAWGMALRSTEKINISSQEYLTQVMEKSEVVLKALKTELYE